MKKISLKKIGIGIIVGVTSLAMATQIYKKDEIEEMHHYRPIPVIVFNDRVQEEDEEETEVQEKEEAKESVVHRMLRYVRIIISFPLILFLFFLVNVIRMLSFFALSPLLAFLLKWLLLFIVLLLFVAFIVKLLFPNLTWKQILDYRNILFLMAISLGLCFVDLEEIFRAFVSCFHTENN